MSIGIANYKTKDKNVWRRKCWRDISNRIPDKSSARIVYLAAEQDLDRKIAIKFGFKPWNMVAVDMRKSVVDKLRAENKIAITGRIEHVAPAFGDAMVVHADFCCGFTEAMQQSLFPLFKYGLLPQGSVCLFNFQRGREKGDGAAYIKSIQQGSLKQKFANTEIKSRACIAWDFVEQSIIELYIWAGLDTFGKINRTIVDQGSHVKCFYDSASSHKVHALRQWINQQAKPRIRSYKSSVGRGLRFDTLIFTNPLGGFFDLFAGKRKELRGIPSFDSIFSHTRDVGAAKAIQSMRVSGKLAPCGIH